MKTLLCDLDGCLVNFNEPFRDLLLKTHGPRGSYEEALKVWKWPRAMGYTKAEEDEVWDQTTEEWWETLPPLPGAEAALEQLAQLEFHNGRDFQVYFVTGRLPHVRWSSQVWLSDHGFGGANVISTSYKSKLTFAFMMDGAVAAIEDKPSILQSYLIERVYCIMHPYNQGAPANVHTNSVLNAVQDLASYWSLKTQTPHAGEPSEA